MQKSNEIIKIVYNEKIINPDDLARAAKVKYVLYPDGSQSVFEYDYDKKAYVLIEKAKKTNTEDFIKLSKCVDDLIRNATGIYTRDDDRDGTVTIFRAFGRAEKMDRSYGTEENCICELITSYSNSF